MDMPMSDRQTARDDNDVQRDRDHHQAIRPMAATPARSAKSANPEAGAPPLPLPWQWRHERPGDDVNGAAIVRGNDAPRFTPGTMSSGTKFLPLCK
jgi:hypothetical protein